MGVSRTFSGACGKWQDLTKVIEECLRGSAAKEAYRGGGSIGSFDDEVMHHGECPEQGGSQATHLMLM